MGVVFDTIEKGRPVDQPMGYLKVGGGRVDGISQRGRYEIIQVLHYIYGD